MTYIIYKICNICHSLSSLWHWKAFQTCFCTPFLFLSLWIASYKVEPFLKEKNDVKTISPTWLHSVWYIVNYLVNKLSSFISFSYFTSTLLQYTAYYIGEINTYSIFLDIFMQVSKAEFGAHLCVRSAESIPLWYVRIEAWANEDAAGKPRGQLEDRY